MPFSCNKSLSQRSAESLPDRYILQIRLRTRKSSCSCNSLLVMAVYPAVMPDKRLQSLDICAGQLSDGPVLKYKRYDLVSVLYFLEYISTCALALLGLLPGRKSQFFKQYNA